MKPYALLLFTGAKQGLGYVANITSQAEDWARSIRLQGGFWQGTFTVQGELSELQDWFYNRLGYHLVERSGGVQTWEGLIYELDLVAGGVRRRRSLDTISNAVLSSWQRSDGAMVPLGWTSQAQSIARYGRKELVSSGQGSEGEAVRNRDQILRENAWPWPRAVSVGKAGEAALEVTACGYAYALNWRHAGSVGGAWNLTGRHGWKYWDGSRDTDLSSWIDELLTDDGMELLASKTIRNNGQGHQKFLDQQIRLWEFLQELVQLGDAAGNPWRLYCERERRIVYEPVNLTPAYYVRREGLFQAASGSQVLNPYLVRPGVVRDMQYPRGRQEPGSVLSDHRDILVDEVHVDAGGTLALRTSAFTEADLLAAQAEASQRRASWLRAAADRAWEDDYRKRKAEWDALHPGVPFPG